MMDEEKKTLLGKAKHRITTIREKRKTFINRGTHSAKHAIHFHNGTQFFGAVNDNVFKFLIVFILIADQGVQHSSEILFWVGTIYILPFLLFSSFAGIISDRSSKQKMIVRLKVSEIVITLLGVLAFSTRSALFCYSLLFLLSLQSALFGPPKYSIIPEIVRDEAISKSNGLITSFTYLAIIIGTFLATFITDISGHNFVLTGWMCVLIALVGWICSLFIPFTKPQRSKRKPKWFFLKEIYQTLKMCRKEESLLVCIFGSAFFLYVGGFFQLNVIPYAIESLGMSEEGGGYLFLTVAIGIAVGAVIAGRLSKTYIELGLTAIGGLGLALFLLLLSVLPLNLLGVQILLVFIGLSGGFFIVPFEAFIQSNSPIKIRGQVVATANFMSFVGVLFASCSIYLFGGIFKLKAEGGFFIVSLINFFAMIFIIRATSRYILHLYARFASNKTKKHLIEPLAEAPSLLLFPNFNWQAAFSILQTYPNTTFALMKRKKRFSHVFFNLFPAIKPIYSNDEIATLSKTSPICVLSSGAVTPPTGVHSYRVVEEIKEDHTKIHFQPT